MSNQIELRHLQYFKTLGRELHFKKAAEKLFITQPALSRQLKQLEQYVGAELLYRDKRNVSLTQAGAYLLEEIDFVINRIEFITENIRLIQQGEKGEIRIGFVGSAMQVVIPRLLSQISEESPGVHSVLTELPNKDQVERIQKDELDLGFIRTLRLPDGLKKLDVHEETFSLVLPASHPISSETFTTVKSLQEEKFILFSSQYSHGYFEKIISIFEDQGFTPQVAHESVHASTIFRLVENNLGIGIVPTSLKHGFSLDIKFIELDKIPQRTTLSAIWKENNRNPILDKILGYL